MICARRNSELSMSYKTYSRLSPEIFFIKSSTFRISRRKRQNSEVRESSAPAQGPRNSLHNALHSKSLQRNGGHAASSFSTRSDYSDSILRFVDSRHQSSLRWRQNPTAAMVATVGKAFGADDSRRALTEASREPGRRLSFRPRRTCFRT